jgi:hypothetical protein
MWRSCTQRRQRISSRPAVILFVLTGQVPAFLALLLLALVYLSWIELRTEPMSDLVKVWWCLLVALLNVPAYLALRLWLAARRRRA